MQPIPHLVYLCVGNVGCRSRDFHDFLWISGSKGWHKTWGDQFNGLQFVAHANIPTAVHQFSITRGIASVVVGVTSPVVDYTLFGGRGVSSLVFGGAVATATLRL
jgi:hypothetical protein